MKISSEFFSTWKQWIQTITINLIAFRYSMHFLVILVVDFSHFFIYLKKKLFFERGVVRKLNKKWIKKKYVLDCTILVNDAPLYVVFVRNLSAFFSVEKTFEQKLKLKLKLKLNKNWTKTEQKRKQIQCVELKILGINKDKEQRTTKKLNNNNKTNAL